VVIVTCAPDAESDAQADMRAVDPAAKLDTWLAPGIGLLRPGALTFDALGSALRAAHLPFIRHLAPVARTLRLTGRDDDADALRDAVAALASRATPDASFAVQVRYAGARRQPLSEAGLSRMLDEPLLDAGLRRDVREPGWIVSLLCCDDLAYLGASVAEQNLSNWAGGAQRFREEQDMISRAEFKLLEALSVFNVALPERGQALDLGASPGGWTRVLRMRGISVTAVDPADLHASLRRDTGVRHVRRWALPFLDETRERYDVLVNDMRMDALESAQVMLRGADVLTPGALAVMTIKLPERGGRSKALRAIDALQARYAVLGARQLHHNRSEITVVLRARDTQR
jgi:23S rRNA (cytidine2498-2'-O)-methyltransferase